MSDKNDELPLDNQVSETRRSENGDKIASLEIDDDSEEQCRLRRTQLSERARRDFQLARDLLKNFERGRPAQLRRLRARRV